MTPVIFRKFPDGEIVALMPTEPADVYGYLCLSYQHIGQHGEADYTYVVERTRPAEHEEYRALLRELQNVGYDDLRVYDKALPSFHEQRRAESRRVTA